MDTKTLIKSLRTLFSNENKIEKKYSKVWMDGEFYNNRLYRVNVQYDKPFPYSTKAEEISKLKKLINDKIEGSIKRICSVGIYYFNDGYYHCDKDDILVYDDLNDPA